MISLLQPRSYVSSSSKSSKPRSIGLHSKGGIRDSTMHLSNLPLRTPNVTASQLQEAFIFPDVSEAPDEMDAEALPLPSASVPSLLSSRHFGSVTDLTASTTTTASAQSGTMTPRGHSGPSGLSLLLARQNPDEPVSSGTSDAATSRAERPPFSLAYTNGVRPLDRESPSIHYENANPGEAHNDPSESAPLLSDVEAAQPSYNGGRHPSQKVEGRRRGMKGALSLLPRLKLPTPSLRVVKVVSADAVQSLPAVLLGTLLNILDGISCKDELYRIGRCLYICRWHDYISCLRCVFQPRRHWRLHVLPLVSQYCTAPFVADGCL